MGEVKEERQWWRSSADSRRLDYERVDRSVEKEVEGKKVAKSKGGINIVQFRHSVVYLWKL